MLMFSTHEGRPHLRFTVPHLKKPAYVNLTLVLIFTVVRKYSDIWIHFFNFFTFVNRSILHSIL